MGFFEDLGDILDPLGITDFDNSGSHDFVEGVVATAIADKIINEDDSFIDDIFGNDDMSDD